MINKREELIKTLKKGCIFINYIYKLFEFSPKKKGSSVCFVQKNYNNFCFSSLIMNINKLKKRIQL